MSKSNNRVALMARNMDDRYTMSSGIRRQINKVFPTHWSFMLGEIALYSFVVLLLSGVYLTLFFDPSMSKVIYDGAYAPLNGVEMSRAYETALQISFEVRGGLFIRQVHHWAALLFAISIMAHMFRIFFTGAFRKPREANWVIGCILLLLSIAEGFMGYSLPDDLLSGVGLRIMSAIIIGLPVIGTWMHWMMFNGDFPGDIIIPRLYIAHVLIIPALLLGLIAAHLALVWYQKHTQFPGPGRTENNVVGVRIMPVFAVKALTFGLINIGFLAFLAGAFQINAIWNLGPYNPSQVSAGSQPDIYMLWTDGAARVMPAWELYIGSYTIPAVVWVALLLGLLVVLLFAYPFIEAKMTGDDAHHNLTYRICIGLQRSDQAVLEHGIETGIIDQLPSGAFIEVHQPLGPVDEHGHAVPLEYQGGYVPKTMNALGAAGTPGRGGWFSPDSQDIADEAARIEDENHHQRTQMLRDLETRNAETRGELDK